jgi:hypothetical protein
VLDTQWIVEIVREGVFLVSGKNCFEVCAGASVRLPAVRPGKGPGGGYGVCCRAICALYFTSLLAPDARQRLAALGVEARVLGCGG